MYPASLQPLAVENFIINGKSIEIPKTVVHFDRWKGIPLNETFGGKPVLSIDDKPMFAELAIMSNFIKDGWQSRWIETYGKSNKSPIYLTQWKDDRYINQVHNPINDKEILIILEGIAKENNSSYSGCWDVLAWKNEHIIFSESKRKKKDHIRLTQVNWLAAALKYGLKTDNFLIVQWDM